MSLSKHRLERIQKEIALELELHPEGCGKINLVRWELDEANILFFPTTQRPDQLPEAAVTHFLHHLDQTSQERYVSVYVIGEHTGPLTLIIPCLCCYSAFLRYVNTWQEAYYTIHILNETAWNVIYLTTFVKEEQ